MMVSATPVPTDPNWRQGPVAAIKMEEPKSFPIAKIDKAERRQEAGLGGLGVMSMPPMYTSSFFGGKRPFEYISGPYESTSMFGQPFQGGPFGGLGVPLSSGPLGGIMSVPLLYFMG